MVGHAARWSVVVGPFWTRILQSVYFWPWAPSALRCSDMGGDRHPLVLTGSAVSADHIPPQGAGHHSVLSSLRELRELYILYICICIDVRCVFVDPSACLAYWIDGSCDLVMRPRSLQGRAAQSLVPNGSPSRTRLFGHPSNGGSRLEYSRVGFVLIVVGLTSVALRIRICFIICLYKWMNIHIC